MVTKHFVPLSVCACKDFNFYFSYFVSAPVAEHPRIGSDGESEEASATSDDFTSPARLRPTVELNAFGVKLRPKTHRRHSEV